MGIFSKKMSLLKIVVYTTKAIVHKYNDSDLDRKKANYLWAVDMTSGLETAALMADLDDIYAKWFNREVGMASVNDPSRVIIFSEIHTSLSALTEHQLPKEFEGASNFEIFHIVYLKVLKYLKKEPLCEVE